MRCEVTACDSNIEIMFPQQLAFLISALTFMFLGISVCDQPREKVYPKVIRKTRTKRESSVAHNLEVK